MKKIILFVGILLLVTGASASANCHPGHVEGGAGHQHGSGSAKALNDLGKEFAAILESAGAVSAGLAEVLEKGADAGTLKKASGLSTDLSAAMDELSTIMFLGSAEGKDVDELKSKVDKIRSQAESLKNSKPR